MKKVRLGKTELMVTKTSFGALPIQRISKAEAVKLIRKAYENGINYFDTANAYTDSEEKLAELQMQMLDPALASDYPKLMELQSAVDAEEANQDSLLERMLETETELAEYEEA